jgi:WXG100 family type VII secretion target
MSFPFTIAEVEKANFDALTGAAGRLGSHLRAMQQQLKAGQEALDRLRGGWEGQASEAAIAKVERTLQHQQRIVTAVQRVQSALSESGSQLSATRAGILQGVEQSGRQGWHVGKDGGLSAHRGKALDRLAQTSPVTAMKLQQVAATKSLNMKKQLADLDKYDRQLARTLREALHGLED